MKNLKILMVASLLGFVLVMGQPHATMAATTNNNTVPSPDGFFFSPNFDVNVDFVGVDGLTPLDRASDGAYYLQTNSSFTTIRAVVTASGYTNLDGMRLGGTLIMINNGEPTVASSAVLGAAGFNVPVSAEYNTISFLYVGYGDSGYQWAQASINVVKGWNFTAIDEKYDEAYLDVSYGASDLADSTSSVDVELLTYNALSGVSKNVNHEPDMSALDITYTDLFGQSFDLDNGQGVNGGALAGEGAGSIKIGGTINTTGFFGDQFKGMNLTTLEYDGDTTHTAAKGAVFYIDNSGAHMLQAGNEIGASFEAAVFTSGGEVTTGSYPHTVLALAPSGYLDASYGVGADWESIADQAGLDGSVDFGIDYDSFNIRGYYIEPVDVETSTVSVQSTVNIETTEETPGFTGVVVISAAAAVAYLTPRFRKEE